MDRIFRRGLQPLAPAFTSNRILWYSVFSTLVTSLAIANACQNYSNFYSVAVYLSRSGRSLLVSMLPDVLCAPFNSYAGISQLWLHSRCDVWPNLATSLLWSPASP